MKKIILIAILVILFTQIVFAESFFDILDDFVGFYFKILFSTMTGRVSGDGGAIGCLSDSDGDGICDEVDNCINVPNINQANSDSDTLGNACDNCVNVANQNQQDSDNDGLGNACDNCPSVNNPDQHDCDSDSIGDLCDPIPGCNPQDSDLDGIPDLLDNCPTTYNPTQANADGDPFGDACDVCPNALNVDNDSDGYYGCANDCDDNDDLTYPGAPEICDTYDNDCDTQVDEGNVCNTTSSNYTPSPPPPGYVPPPGYTPLPGQPSSGYQPPSTQPQIQQFDVNNVLNKVKLIRTKLNAITNNLAKIREQYKGQAEESKYTGLINLASVTDTEYRNLLIYINQNRNNPDSLPEMKQRIRNVNQKAVVLDEIYSKV